MANYCIPLLLRHTVLRLNYLFAHYRRLAFFSKVSRVLVVALVNFTPFLPDRALAQDITYATGAIPASEAERVAIPPTPLTRTFLPELVDLSSRFPRIGDQGRLGSCTAWAVGYAARSYYETLDSDRGPDQKNIPSPAYIYASLAPMCDRGTSTAAAMELLEVGAVSLSDMPYSDRSCPAINADLRTKVRQEGSFRIESWRGIRSGDDSGTAIFNGRQNLPDMIKAQLAMGHPVVTAIQTDRAFHSLHGRSIWERREPASRGGDGWHAITLVGYNERGQYFKFINSWGTDWGDKGFGRLSYQTIIDHDEMSYVMKVAGVDPEPPKPTPEPTPPPNPLPRPGPAPVPVIRMPEVSCGKLQAGPANGPRQIIGFVGTQQDLDKVAAVAAEAGIIADVELRPWPQCETLMTLDGPLAQSDPPRIHLPQPEYAAGETLAFSVAMAGFEGFIHIAYIQADGTVVNLAQQSAISLQTQPRNSVQLFGDGKDGRAHFEVAGPFGNEMIIAIASASPLFDEPRPTVEVEREFLTALRQAILARPDRDLPERRVTATYDILTTKEN